MSENAFQPILDRMDRMERKLDDLADLQVQFVRLTERSEHILADLDCYRNRMETELERSRKAQERVEEKAQAVMSRHDQCSAPRWVTIHNWILGGIGAALLILAGYLLESQP